VSDKVSKPGISFHNIPIEPIPTPPSLLSPITSNLPDKDSITMPSSNTNDNDDSSQPLLSSDTTRAANTSEIDQDNTSAFKRHYRRHQEWLQDFLASRTQHFCVLGLVSLDLLGIFADIFINLYTCEEGEPSPTWDAIRSGLGIAGLVFSCLFMLELILSVWAFGWRLDCFLLCLISSIFLSDTVFQVPISNSSKQYILVSDKIVWALFLTRAQIFHLLLP
jgi:hypothetical protein